MNRPIDPRRIEVVDEAVAAVLRTKLPHERIAMALDAWDTARLLIQGGVMTAHPEWSPEAVRREVARRLALARN